MRHYTRLYIVKYYLHLQFGLLYELLDHIFGVLILDAKSLNQLAVCTYTCALISGSRRVQNIKGENDGQMVIPNHRTIGPDVFFFALLWYYLNHKRTIANWMM